MASDSNSSSIPSWQFMALLAAALGAFLTSERLGSLSPAALEPENDNGNLIDAHLSDDPFDAWVRAAKKSDSLGKPPFPDAPISLLPGPLLSTGDLAALLKDRAVCILPVIVRGDFHSTEAREMRIRFRAATVSGLGADGLIADDPEHLLLLSPPKAWTSGSDKRTPNIALPFPAEWFIAGSLLAKPKPKTYGAVLVVWIRDEALFLKPLATLDALKEDLTAQVNRLNGFANTPVDFKVIGPYWSGTLADMLAEKKSSLSSKTAPHGVGTYLYSATATMADGVLELIAGGPVDKPSVPSPAGHLVAEVPAGREGLADPRNGPVLVSLTCTDEEIAAALFDELGLRDVDTSDSNTVIAIMSDWDTAYGRYLPLTYGAKLDQLNHPTGSPDQKASERGASDPASDCVPPAAGVRPLTAARFAAVNAGENLPTRQIFPGYFISNVGGTATSTGGGSKADASGKTDSDGSDSKAFERAEGEQQVDYIARLGMTLADRLKALKPDDSTGGAPSKSKPKLRAIGVLGSNVYDDLLLLEALRPRFPDAVFFTDKLDARFFDPASMKYTRNLVVVTSYGLELFHRLQVGVAPFRSSEQTGAFLAVEAAAASQSQDVRCLRKQMQPLRFEIGRTKPMRLFVKDQVWPDNGAACRFKGLLHPRFELPLYPVGPYLLKHGLHIISAAFVAVLFATVTVYLSLGRIRLGKDEWRTLRLGGWLVAAVIGVFLIFVTAYDGIEPMALLEGVSVWPSEFLRLLALITGLAGIIYYENRVQKSREDLCTEFGFIPAPPLPASQSGFSATLRDVVFRTYPPDDDFIMTERQEKVAAQSLLNSANDFDAAVGVAKKLPPGDRAAKSEPTYISTQLLWRYLCERSTRSRRNMRAGLMTVSYLFGLICLIPFIEFPVSPTRGILSWGFDKALTLAPSILLIYLIFWVVDETQSCYRFVRRLGYDRPSLWPKKAYENLRSINRFAASRANDERKAASAYVEVCFIGKLTAEAVPLIILPFVVLTLLFAARWRLFANWPLAPSILVILSANALICVVCALLLKNVAAKAKSRAIRNIGINAADARAAGADGFADSLDALRSDMEDNQEGAFLPWHQQPFVRAVLLPFGGTGVLQAVEFFVSKK
jgi:hypothetical protein